MTGLAEPNELKQVTIYSEPGLVGEALLHFSQFTVGEINNPTAVRANQVVVVPWGTNCVAVAATSSVQLTDKP